MHSCMSLEIYIKFKVQHALMNIGLHAFLGIRKSRLSTHVVANITNTLQRLKLDSILCGPS